MLYVIIGEDHPGTLDQRLAARPAHVERLQALQADGRLILAGPCPAIDSPDPGPAGFSGSIIVAEFASLACRRGLGRRRSLCRRRRLRQGHRQTLQEGPARVSGETVELLRRRLAVLQPLSMPSTMNRIATPAMPAPGTAAITKSP
jgi:uncharacterized protein YciI